MSLPTCRICQYRLEKVSVTSTLHLGVRLLLELAVKNDPDDANIPSLRQLKNSAELEYQQAVDQYRIHQLSHEKEAVKSGVSSASTDRRAEIPR